MTEENNNYGIHFLATGRALPKKIVTNDELSRTVDTSDEWIRTRTGIGQRYLCEEESCMTLAIEAAKKALEKAQSVKKDILSDIGAVVVATATSDYAFPSMGCMVKEALGLEDDVMAFDISAACSGFLYGLEVLRGLLVTGKKKYGLLIGSEQMSRITDFTDRSTCVLFGDGAGAAIIGLDRSEYAHRAWSRGNDEVLCCAGPGPEPSAIHMEGNQVFKFAVNAIAQGVETILKDKELTMDQIDYVVCHQANERIIDHVRKKYPGCEEKFYKNIERYANTSAASIPIALDEMFEKNILKEGMKIICVGFGAGLTWSSALLTI
ncbi:MAG: beta-ketoacyl-ACP synthase III [Lachnospiraceae bacterium]